MWTGIRKDGSNKITYFLIIISFVTTIISFDSKDIVSKRKVHIRLRAWARSKSSAQQSAHEV